MNGRINYIDSMKGLAILLMVMGHVIAYQFADYNVAYDQYPRITMVVYRIIYSFHMPLFMFCAGLFALRINEYTWSSFGQSLWKRAYTLLLPFFCSGFIFNHVRHVHAFFWFLWMLFWFIVFVMVVDALCSVLPKYGQIVSSCIIAVMAVIVHIAYHKFLKYEHLPWVDIGHLRQFPFFCMGVLCARYNLCEKWFSQNGIFTGALLVFGFFTYWITIKGYSIPLQYITWCVLPISAIVACVYLFKEGLSGNSIIEKCLQDIGRHSLEIYIIHNFFLFRMCRIGEFVFEQASVEGGGRTIFFVQLVSSFLSSVVIIVLCYLVMNIINKSRILSLVLLGRKSTIS